MQTKPNIGGSQNPLSEDDRVRIVALRREGLTIEQISERAGRAPSTIGRCLDKALSKEERHALSRISGQAARSMEREIGPPARVLAERDYRRSLAPRDLTAGHFGDPLPGYSALERGA